MQSAKKADADPRLITAQSLRAKKGKERIVAVTAYDATFAKLLDDAGVDILLVGDSLGMVIQGQANTLGVTLQDILYHCRAVARGARRAHVVADMPFMTYQISKKEALRNAGRCIQEGGAHAVKIEGGVAMAKTIERMVSVGIAVMGHVGLMPQSVHAQGGYRVQGREPAEAQRIVEDARAVQEAGAYSVVLEGIPRELSEHITSELSIPTIGIGAGRACDGQVLVSYDLLGLLADFQPKFVKRYENFYERGVAALQRFCSEVRSGEFPNDENSFASAPPAAHPHTLHS